MHKALYQKTIDTDSKKIQCFLCPHNCIIPDGSAGRCRVRKNTGGILYSLIYGRHTSVALDPIEKKPLYHFYPGGQILSFGTLGCNMTCGFCQNWEISQKPYSDELTREIMPDDVTRLIRNYRSIGIAYTYNEPLINYEWIYDTSQLCSEEGFKNVLVTNGFISEEPLIKLIPRIHAANIDVKSFQDAFYKKLCGGSIGPVLRTVEVMVKKGVHVELTFLVIPKENDDKTVFRDFVDWISSLNRSIPLHLSRYYPQYKFDRDPTPLKTIESLRDIALQKLHYVYVGNVWEKKDAYTYCLNRSCKAVLIERSGYTSKIVGLNGNLCTLCKTENNIIVQT